MKMQTRHALALVSGDASILGGSHLRRGLMAGVGEARAAVVSCRDPERLEYQALPHLGRHCPSLVRDRLWTVRACAAGWAVVGRSLAVLPLS